MEDTDSVESVLAWNSKEKLNRDNLLLLQEKELLEYIHITETPVLSSTELMSMSCLFYALRLCFTAHLPRLADC